MANHSHHKPFTKGRNAQRGAVLAISLLILLVMTMIGVASMGSTTLQEKMANNNNQRQIAFQAAEAALRAGEAFLAANIGSVTDLATNFNATAPVPGLYSERAPVVGVATYPLPVGTNIFNDAGWLIPGNAIQVVSLTNVTQQPRFIIQYMGRAGRSLGGYGGNNPDPRQYSFQITAIGWGEGAAPTARYLLQSSFRMPLL